MDRELRRRRLEMKTAGAAARGARKSRATATRIRFAMGGLAEEAGLSELLERDPLALLGGLFALAVRIERGEAPLEAWRAEAVRRLSVPDPERAGPDPRS